MRRPLIIAAATGVVLAAGVAAGPVFAATAPPNPNPSASASPSPTTCPAWTENGQGRGNGPGYGMGRGRGAGNGPGQGAGPGQGEGRWGGSTADPLAGLSKGTLTTEQGAALAGMAEEEKLARDVYNFLAKTSGDARFTRIAASEERHLTQVRALMTRYDVSDPTADKAAGEFASATVKQQYDAFVARGDDSTAAALAVGREIETADIADLAKARAGVTAPDVLTVYTRLSNASARHLRAFGG